MANRGVRLGFALLCLLCAVGAGLAVRDVAFEITQSAARAEAIGVAVSAVIIGAFAILALFGRRPKG